MAEKIKRGMAFVQFLAMQELIKKKLSEGYNYTLIYEELHNDGKYTGSYKTLSRYIKEFGLKQQVSLIEEKSKDKKIEQPITSKNKQLAIQQIEQPKQHHTKLKEKNDTFMMENYDPVGNLGNSQQNEKKENN